MDGAPTAEQYLAKPGARPYCSAQPQCVSLPPFESWAPAELHAKHAPKLPEVSAVHVHVHVALPPEPARSPPDADAGPTCRLAVGEGPTCRLAPPDALARLLAGLLGEAWAQTPLCHSLAQPSDCYGRLVTGGRGRASCMPRCLRAVL